MNKLAFILAAMLSTGACAQTQEQPPLGDIPPTFDMPEGQFRIQLPLRCTTEAGAVFDRLEHGGYKIAFLGQTENLVGGGLYVTVFLHKDRKDYFVLLANDTGDICELTSGEQGESFLVEDSI